VNFLGKTKHFGWLSRRNSSDCIVKIQLRRYSFSVFIIQPFLRVGQLQGPRLQKSLLIRAASRVHTKNMLIFGSLSKRIGSDSTKNCFAVGVKQITNSHTRRLYECQDIH
jgi:hypothetical protein